MNSHISLILLAGLISIISAQRCVDANTDRDWFTIGNIDYTFTKRNAQWMHADRECRTVVNDGRSQVASPQSLEEWEGLRKVIVPGWYWLDNKKLPLFTDPRYFHFDGTVTKMFEPQDDKKDNCLVYSYPGKYPGKTDFYCKETWAQVLCEVRC